MRTFYVYIMASPSRTLYVGVTNDLPRRILEHKSKPPGAFCSRYNVNRLVFAEEADGSRTAIAREKQIKSWRRLKKIELIESLNPRLEDLSDSWSDPEKIRDSSLRRLRSE